MTTTVGIGEVEPPIPDATSDEEARALALQIAQAADWLLRYGPVEFDALVDETELAAAVAQVQEWATIQLNGKSNVGHNHVIAEITALADTLAGLQGQIDALDTENDGFVLRGGDTMTGALALPGDPVALLDAATKSYVDSQVASIIPQIPPPGLTEAQVLTLIDNAILNLQGTPTGAVTNVDVASGNVTLGSGPWATTDTYNVINATVSGRTVTLPTGVSGTRTFVSARTNTRTVTLIKGTARYSLPAGGFAIVYTDGSANNMRVIASGSGTGAFVSKAGDTMTGALQLSGDPTSALQAATKQYVDSLTSAESVQDIIGGLFNDTTFIDFTYNDVGNVATMDLAATGARNATTYLRGDNTFATRGGEMAPYWGGVMLNGEVLYRRKAIAPWRLPALSGGNHECSATVAATGSTTLTMRKNGVSIGTIVFSASGTTGAITLGSPADFLAGDVFTIEAPATADSTLANVSASLTFLWL